MRRRRRRRRRGMSDTAVGDDIFTASRHLVFRAASNLWWGHRATKSPSRLMLLNSLYTLDTPTPPPNIPSRHIHTCLSTLCSTHLVRPPSLLVSSAWCCAMLLTRTAVPVYLALRLLYPYARIYDAKMIVTYTLKVVGRDGSLTCDYRRCPYLP